MIDFVFRVALKIAKSWWFLHFGQVTIAIVRYNFANLQLTFQYQN